AALIVAALAGFVAAGLVVRQGGSLFGMLLAGAFSFLALQAVNSFARFGLVASVLVAGRPGGWGGRLFLPPPPSPLPRTERGGKQPHSPSPFWGGGWGEGSGATRLGLGAVLVVCVVLVADERYSRWIGDPRRLALRERPLTFAHDAARFAGQPGLPRN